MVSGIHGVTYAASRPLAARSHGVGVPGTVRTHSRRCRRRPRHESDRMRASVAVRRSIARIAGVMVYLTGLTCATGQLDVFDRCWSI